MALTCIKCTPLFCHRHRHLLQRSLRLQLNHRCNLIKRAFNATECHTIQCRLLHNNTNNSRNSSTKEHEEQDYPASSSSSSSLSSSSLSPSSSSSSSSSPADEYNGIALLRRYWRQRKHERINSEQRRHWPLGWRALAGVGGVGLLTYYYIHRHYPNRLQWGSLWSHVEAKTVPNLAGRRKQFNFIADVVDLCADSVVYIEIKDMRHFDYFSGKPATASNGSGFIIESDGTILTNAHVVINKPHTMVQVRLYDGRTFPGVVEDVDQTSDLAIVRIKCNNLPVMRLGTSSNLRSGEWVLALGSPLALSNTVTAGVISSTQRPSQELGLHNRDINYLQTDAAITFGNSGGPLVNLDGEAIGVNSMKVTAGISFAIPIDYVKLFLRKVEERRKRGSAQHTTQSSKRYMGITMLTLTTDILNELRMRSDHFPSNLKHGVLVWKVVLRSPADIGGLMPGDIVTHINRKQIKTSSDVYDALSQSVKTLNLTILRGDKELNITIVPEDPDDYQELLHK